MEPRMYIRGFFSVLPRDLSFISFPPSARLLLLKMPLRPSRADFLDQVADFVGKRFPLVKLTTDADQSSIRINGHWTRLENLYRTVADRPDLFAKQVERWVVELLRAAEGTPDQTAPFDEIKDRILPMLLSKGPRDVAGMALI